MRDKLSLKSAKTCATITGLLPSFVKVLMRCSSAKEQAAARDPGNRSLLRVDGRWPEPVTTNLNVPQEATVVQV